MPHIQIKPLTRISTMGGNKRRTNSSRGMEPSIHLSIIISSRHPFTTKQIKCHKDTKTLTTQVTDIKTTISQACSHRAKTRKTSGTNHRLEEITLELKICPLLKTTPINPVGTPISWAIIPISLVGIQINSNRVKAADGD